MDGKHFMRNVSPRLYNIAITMAERIARQVPFPEDDETLIPAVIFIVKDELVNAYELGYADCKKQMGNGPGEAKEE